MKTYVMGTHTKCLREVLLMSAHKLYLMAQLEKYQIALLKAKKKLLVGFQAYIKCWEIESRDQIWLHD